MVAQLDPTLSGSCTGPQRINFKMESLFLPWAPISFVCASNSKIWRSATLTESFTFHFRLPYFPQPGHDSRPGLFMVERS